MILGKSEAEFNKIKARVKKVFSAVEMLMPPNKKIKKVGVMFR